MQVNIFIPDELYNKYKELVKITGMKLTKVNENLFIESIKNYIKEGESKDGEERK